MKGSVMDALDVLNQEHRHIQRVLEVLERAVAKGRDGEFVSASLFLRAANFFLTFVDGSHHAKEMVLFQTMVAHRLPLAPGLLAQVSGEHGTGSEHAVAMLCAAETMLRGGETDPSRMLDAADDWLRLYRGHTGVEEAQVFPMARRLLPAGILDRMRTRFARIEASHGSLAEAAEAMERAFTPVPAGRLFPRGPVCSF
ncbi:hypothetical protein BHS07_28270 [Myxococcus xanthus]|uniref:Hemerythrin-like domain-containing protein n=2 Tax=Myxococcaceae TaxID=31 RepID=A0AAE6G3S5_MYXXA|nr:hypothetical protein BHS09_27705 [Myxococcus xanthus]QDE77725.1 hypothetical protein BHS08_27725 [Myxococcus xanthus]QDE85110.1 hypothetical protein BHS07_28270 [Myxococcus xanthus]QDE99269.1 hypothetical protein BHS05_27515 [Myxococcus xanthus]QDF06966.1 hypothetical protein BHS04_27815 [Myxococcus xanthus]